MALTGNLKRNGFLIGFCGWLVFMHWGWQKMQSLPAVEQIGPPAKFPLLEALSELNHLLRKSVGPHGKINLLQSAGGLLTLTSVSRRILMNLVFDNPIFQFILQIILSHINRFEDGGLYCGIVLCTLYRDMLSSKIPLLPHRQLLTSFRSLVETAFLNRDSNLHFKVSLDSVSPLLIIAKSVLWSKPSTSHSASEQMPILLVKSFLDSDGHIGRIKVHVLEKSIEPQLHHGVLYVCVDDEHKLLNFEPWSHVSIIVVTAMLSDESSASEQAVRGVEQCWDGAAQLLAAQHLLELAVACGVRIVACQRVIHPSLLVAMRRRGILALQRMGARLTEAVQTLSGATPIASLKSISDNSLASFKGYLDTKHLRLSEKNYLLLNSSSSVKFVTLFLPSLSLESASELEVVAGQALSALRRACEDGVVVPGAGCSEVYISSFLWNMVAENQSSLCESCNCSPSELRAAVVSVQFALIHAVGLASRNGSTAVDSVYHHAWKNLDPEPQFSSCSACCCGLVSSSDVVQFDGKWHSFCVDNEESLFPMIWCHSPQPPKFKGSAFCLSAAQSAVVLDVLSTKWNAFTLAVDNCVGLSNVGAIAFTDK